MSLLANAFKFKKTRNEISYRTVDFTEPSVFQGIDFDKKQTQMKLSAVYASIDMISNSLSKMPFFVVDTKTNKHVDNLKISYLLSVQPNRNMTPSVFKKLIECWRLSEGNAYVYIVYDSKGYPQELLPIHPNYVRIIKNGSDLFYDITFPNMITKRLFYDEILHFKGFSFDGINGESVLSYAAKTIRTGLYQERYQDTFYENNGRPSGVLEVDADLDKDDKDLIREEWKKAHSQENAFNVAVLDLGSKYTPITPINQKDAEFVASKEVTLADIARFFGIPLYKLNAGKQSYSSNEQNAIGFITDTMAPIVLKYEEEFTIKVLNTAMLQSGFKVKANMNVELRGDIAARGIWYKTMREVGAYSVNDIREYEDMEKVEGGNSRMVSLNYIPLEHFVEISKERNGGNKK